MKLKYILLFVTFLGFSKIYAGDILTLAHPKNTLKATKVSRPGNLVGCDLALSRSSYHTMVAGKKTNINKSFSFGIIPTFQFNIADNYAASIGLRITSDNSKYDNGSYHSEEKEMSYGPSLSFYRFCDDPCDDDDWSPFGGVNVGYYSGPRNYTNWDDNTPMVAPHVENGKNTSFDAGIFGGTFYQLNNNFGLLGKVSLVNFYTYKTIFSKSNPDAFASSSQFRFLDGGSVGVYYILAGKGK